MDSLLTQGIHSAVGDAAAIFIGLGTKQAANGAEPPIGMNRLTVDQYFSVRWIVAYIGCHLELVGVGATNVIPLR